MDIKINHNTEENYTLNTAILLYKNRGGLKNLVSINQIRNINNKPVIGQGRLIETLDLLKIFQNATENQRETPEPIEFIPENILVQRKNLVIWTKEAHTNPIFFSTQDETLNKISGKTVQHPRLIFISAYSQIEVWAVKGNTRPTPETELYYAPYFNISGSNVCMPADYNSTIEGMEKAFFNARFTHEGTGFPYGNIHTEIWTENAEMTAQDQIFNFDEILIPANKKLKDIIQFFQSRQF